MTSISNEVVISIRRLTEGEICPSKVLIKALFHCMRFLLEYLSAKGIGLREMTALLELSVIGNAVKQPVCVALIITGQQ